MPKGDTIHPRFRKDERCYVPYAMSGLAQKEMQFAESEKDFHFNFTTPKKDILKDPQLAGRLRFLVPTNRMLGRHVNNVV